MSLQAAEPVTVTEDRDGSGATAAQRGFEYQLNVSVLAALRMMLVTKSAARITLEPANEDDLEADLEPTNQVVCSPARR